MLDVVPEPVASLPSHIVITVGFSALELVVAVVVCVLCIAAGSWFLAFPRRGLAAGSPPSIRNAPFPPPRGHSFSAPANVVHRGTGQQRSRAGGSPSSPPPLAQNRAPLPLRAKAKAKSAGHGRDQSQTHSQRSPPSFEERPHQLAGFPGTYPTIPAHPLTGFLYSPPSSPAISASEPADEPQPLPRASASAFDASDAETWGRVWAEASAERERRFTQASAGSISGSPALGEQAASSEQLVQPPGHYNLDVDLATYTANCVRSCAERAAAERESLPESESTDTVVFAEPLDIDTE